MVSCDDIEISCASAPAELDAVRCLWREYWDFLRLSGTFQNFDEEFRSLPGVYAPPAGRLLLARIGGAPAGSAAFRPLVRKSCEAKRLYVRPAARRRGVGTALLDRLIAEARAAGYSEMYADTLNTMQSAMRMYRDLGFIEVGPYSPSPTPDAIYLKLVL